MLTYQKLVLIDVKEVKRRKLGDSGEERRAATYDVASS